MGVCGPPYYHAESHSLSSTASLVRSDWLTKGRLPCGCHVCAARRGLRERFVSGFVRWSWERADAGFECFVDVQILRPRTAITSQRRARSTRTLYMHKHTALIASNSHVRAARHRNKQSRMATPNGASNRRTSHHAPSCFHASIPRVPKRPLVLSVRMVIHIVVRCAFRYIVHTADLMVDLILDRSLIFIESSMLTWSIKILKIESFETKNRL